MKLYLKYTAVFLMIALMGLHKSYAQKKENTKEGEIVMRQSELDSLLNKIKVYKQQQREKERATRKALSKTKYDSIMGYSNTEKQGRATGNLSESSQLSGFMNEERIYNEFARLNNRIDWMILNMNGGARAPMRSAGQQSGNGQPNVIYFDSNDDDDTQPFSPGLMRGMTDDTGANTASGKKKTVVEKKEVDDSALKEAEAKSSDLKNQLAEMNEKARVLNKLQESTGNDSYDEEIAGLNAKIEDLKSELAESKKQAGEERERISSRKAALRALQDQDFSIHFVNNSTAFSGADKTALKNLASKVIENEGVTVVLHGYASKSGNAYYNQQLSYKRASAVRKVLRDAGVKSRDIVIMPHGVDESGDADSARRVDVELSSL